MYMAVIKGWTEVRAFSESESKAKKLAIAKKKSLCFGDDLPRWNWESVSEYYGAYTEEITEGVVFVEG